MYGKVLTGLAVAFLLLTGSETGGQSTQANKPALRPKATLRKTPQASPHTVATKDVRDLWISIFPVGTRIYGLWTDARNSETVYVATHRGLFKTVNGGMYWAPLFLKETDSLTFSQSRSSPNVLYLGTNSARGWKGAVWKSEDGGLNWRDISSGSIIYGVRSVEVDPTNANVAYVVSNSPRGGVLFSDCDLYKTANGGRTWANITPEGPKDNLNLALNWANPENLILTSYTYAVATPHWVSEDGGVTWNKETYDATVYPFGPGNDRHKAEWWTFLEFHPPNGNLLLGLAGVNGWPPPNLVVSQDGGSSWADISIEKFVRVEKNPYLGDRNVFKRISIASLDWLARSPSVIYAGTDGGLYVTKDIGKTWQKLIPYATAATAAGAGNTVYAATDRGLLRSPDAGRTWHEASLGLPIEAAVTDSIATSLAEQPFEAFDEGFRTTVRKLAWVDTARKTIYVGDRAGFWTSSTEGLTWSWHSVQTDDGENLRQIVVGGDGTAYLSGVAQGAFATGGSEIIELDPSGKATKMRLDKSPRLLALSPVDPKVLYLTAREPQGAAWAFSPKSGTVLLKSDDGGFSWAAIDLMRWLPASLRTYRIAALPIVAVSPESSKILYVAADVVQSGFGGRHETALLATTDGGSTWQDVSSALKTAMSKGKSSGTLDQIVCLVIDSEDPRIAYLATTGGIFRSGDGGKVWTSLAVGAWQGKIVDIAVSPSSSRHLYVAAESGIWSSRDSGKTWMPLNRGLWGDRIRKLVASGPFVLAQGYNGIYQLSDSSLTWATPEWQRLEKDGELSKTWSPPGSGSGPAPLPAAQPSQPAPRGSSSLPRPPSSVQPSPTAAQPSSAAPLEVTKRFYVRHRDRGLAPGGGFGIVTSYSEGWLIVTPNGIVAYDCTRADSVFHRCERGRFPPIKEVKLYEGGLRISLVQGGNWDFFGAESDIQSAYSAILPYTDEGRKSVR